MLMKQKKNITYLIGFLICAIIIEVLICNSSFINNIKNNPVSVDLKQAVCNENSHISSKNGNDLIMQGAEGESCFASFKVDGPIKTVGIKADAVNGMESWIDYTGENAYVTLSSNMTEVTVYVYSGNECIKIISKLIGQKEGAESVICINAPMNTDSIILETESLKGIATRITAIDWNAKVPFHFSIFRCMFIFLGFVSVYLFRTEGLLWKYRLFKAGRVNKQPAIIIILLVLVFAITAATLMYKVKPYSFGDGGFYPYQDLAHAFAQGRTYIDTEPSPELLSMEDPYDYIARTENGVSYKMDYVFYNGRYYVYFGVIPCLTFFFPYYLITGSNLSGWVVIWIFLLLAYLGSFILLIEITKRYGKDISMAVFFLLHMGMLGALTIPDILSDPNNYFIPMLAGIICFIWGCIVLFKSDNGEGKHIKLFLAGLLLASTAGCRPQMALWVIILFPAIFHIMGRKKINYICFLIPFVLIASGLMYYNFIRFGNPFEFGSRYNLTFADTYHTTFSRDYAGKGILYYLFRGMRFNEQWPYLKNEILEWDNAGILASKASSGGLFVTMPFFVLGAGLLIIFVYYKKKKIMIEKSAVEGLTVGMSAFILGVVIVLLDAGKGGLMERYKLDFAMLFGISAVIFCLLVLSILKSEFPDESSRGLLVCHKVLIILAFWAVIYSASRYGIGGVWNLKDANPEWYSAISNGIEWWK